MPGKALQKMAQKLLSEYGADDIAVRLKDLSRNVNREGEMLVEGASVVGEQREANDKQLAAGDIINIGGMINAIAAGEPLQRDELEGNGYLRLFNPPHPGIEPPLKKCLKEVGSWCIEQGVDLADEQADLLLQGLDKDAVRADKIAQDIVYIDQTAALLVSISRLSDAVLDELHRQHKPDIKRGGKAG